MYLLVGNVTVSSKHNTLCLYSEIAAAQDLLFNLNDLFNANALFSTSVGAMKFCRYTKIVSMANGCSRLRMTG